MKRIFTILFSLMLPLISQGQDHTYTICAGDSVLFDLQSLNPNHSDIGNISFADVAVLDLNFPNQYIEFLGEDVLADSTVVYAKPPSAGSYAFSYDYFDEDSQFQTYNGSVEIVIEDVCTKPLPCFDPSDADLAMPAMFDYSVIAMGDVTNDQTNDVVVGFQNGLMICSNTGSAFLENNNGVFQYNPTTDVALNDFNDDGWLDIFTAKSADALDPSQILLNDLGNFTITLGNFPSARDVELQDNGGVGYVDIFLSGTPAGNTEIHRWDGAQYNLVQTLPNQGQLTLGDFDNDGDDDLLVSPYFLDDFSDLDNGSLPGDNQITGNPNPYLYLNDGSGNYSETNFLSYQAPIFADDFNGDGLIDFVTVNNGANEVWLNGTTGFTFSQSLGDAYTVDVASGDLDQDGDLDLVTANRSGTISRENNIWVNNGDGTFGDQAISFGTYGSFSLAVGDIWGDDAPDIFTTSVFGPSKIYISTNPDQDADGVCDDVDNCLSSFNPDQLDSDDNDIGDACDQGDLYPGDTNNDGVANNYDILNIGLAYAETGTPRVNPSIDWVGQPAADWVDPESNDLLVFADGLNYKFADCDGSGVIDEDDVNAIDQNYGSLHGNDEDEEDDQVGDPPFYVEVLEPAVGGQPFDYTIMLGESLNPANEVYGLAFTVNIDLALVVDGSLEIDFDESWLGDSNDLISVWKEIDGQNKIEIGVSRKYLTQSGSGGMAQMKGVFEPNIDGKDEFELETVFWISDYKLVDDRAEEIPIDAQETLVTISGGTLVEENLKVEVFPNPTSDILNISGLIKNAKIEIVNLLGVNVLELESVNENLKLDLSSIKPGIYFLVIREGNGTQMRKIQVE